MNFVNAHQSKEERQFKYTLSRLYFNHNNARQMRDFTIGHIASAIQTKNVRY